MKRIENIIVLAKKIALSMLKDKKVNEDEIGSLFNPADTKEIFYRLSNQKEKDQRNSFIKKLKQDKKQQWKEIEELVAPKTKLYYLKKSVKYAAVFVGLAGVSYFFYDYYYTAPETYQYAENEIILKHDDGKVEVISEDGTRTLVNKKGEVIGVQKGQQLAYIGDTQTTELKFNVITVPYGKQFQLLLSDSTKVYLNSGTTLKYPIRFLPNQKREVSLVGEAFFEVYKDKKHPFIVKSNDLNIKVLGTKFNVSCYPEDWAINTVLVEGAVSLYNDKKSKSVLKPFTLYPNQRASWINTKKVMKVGNVYDTSIYTCWIDGKIVFKHLKFKNILKKLERHYNVKINNHYTELSEKRFTARFDIETIEQVLNTFSKSFKIDYTKEENIIHIYKPKN
ncbi:FecR family protein [Ochrovirga pacifica]|uniref:FecR family protein n=1 Tax=Ochrovirga pacifica TaxID=1042376 RepID=UPI0002E531B2|nr:FecR family protein [Ochrovirga pacifica]